MRCAKLAFAKALGNSVAHLRYGHLIIPLLSYYFWQLHGRGSGLGGSFGYGLVLFHITAGPDWGDLAYSGVFEQMLRRAISATATTKPTTISRPIPITSTFSQSGAEA